MRIQHNIMAMNAYRNYTNNANKLSGNLEKLSSGYKINRAGDDAAGLAISEKMRAQIKGLEAAQKNVKDGISLVKTAEGATQEIQDMLSRMKYLATQSANGTYENAVDRENLQLEVDALIDEIDRIAQSANFNGITLLDGKWDDGSVQLATQSGGGGDFEVPQSLSANGQVQTLDNGYAVGLAVTAGPAVKASVSGVQSSTAKAVLDKIDFTGSKVSAAAVASLAGKTLKVTFTATTGKVVTVTMSFASKASGAPAGAIVAKGSVTTAWLKEQISSQLEAHERDILAGDDATKVGLDKNSIKLEAKQGGGLNISATVISHTKGTSSGSTATVPKDTTVKIDLKDAIALPASKGFKASDTVTIGDVTYKFSDASGISVQDGTTVTVKLGSTVEKSLKNLVAAVNQQSTSTGVKASLSASGALTLTTTKEFASASAFTKALTVSFGSTVNSDLKSKVEAKWNKAVQDKANEISQPKPPTPPKGNGNGLVLQIGDTAQSFNKLTVAIGGMTSVHLGINDEAGNKLSIASQGAAADAIDKIKNAINYVSQIRGKLGAYQNRLDHTANNLSVMTENIQDAESTIRDTDVAEEMMSYVKNNILVQSAQAMLAQANQLPQGVLQLLG